TQLYYETAGTGTPLILLHGHACDTRMWDDQLEPFALSHQVIRFDSRGFGKSAMPPDEPWSPVDDVKALLEHLGITRAAILGFSMGGGVAIDFALAYPDMTQALIAVDCSPSGFAGPAELAAFWARAVAEAQANGPKAANKFVLTHPVLRFDMEIPHLARRIEQMHLDYSGWYWVNKDLSVDLEPPALQQLERIGVP